MKSFLLFLICVIQNLPIVAQISEKLTEDKGIGNLKIEHPLNKIKGIKKAEEIWFQDRFVFRDYDQIATINPRKNNLNKIYGLNVKRIEVLTENDFIEGESTVCNIILYLKLPKTDIQLNKFYGTFYSNYEDMSNTLSFRDGGIVINLWHGDSDKDSHVTMSLPQNIGLKGFEKHEWKYLVLEFNRNRG